MDHCSQLFVFEQVMESDPSPLTGRASTPLAPCYRFSSFSVSWIFSFTGQSFSGTTRHQVIGNDDAVFSDLEPLHRPVHSGYSIVAQVNRTAVRI